MALITFLVLGLFISPDAMRGGMDGGMITYTKKIARQGFCILVSPVDLICSDMCLKKKEAGSLACATGSPVDSVTNLLGGEADA